MCVCMFWGRGGRGLVLIDILVSQLGLPNKNSWLCSCLQVPLIPSKEKSGK